MRIIWLRVSTNRPKWLSTGAEPVGNFFIFERSMIMEYKHELENKKEETECKQEQAADRARQEQEWWRSVKYPDAPSSSER